MTDHELPPCPTCGGQPIVECGQYRGRWGAKAQCPRKGCRIVARGRSKKDEKTAEAQALREWGRVAAYAKGAG
jgi:hypothetical protein